jgi:hypothetical protein
MGKLTGNAVTHHTLLAAAATPSILVGDTAGQHRPIR